MSRPLMPAFTLPAFTLPAFALSLMTMAALPDDAAGCSFVESGLVRVTADDSPACFVVFETMSDGSR